MNPMLGRDDFLLMVMSILLPLCVWCPSLPALEYGLNCNAPINAITGDISATADAAVLAQTGTRWVRVNFILGPWSSPADSTARGQQNLSWFGTYDRIVDGIISHGMQVYGLIGAEAVKGHSRSTLNTESFVGDYTANFLAIVEHFRDRVKVYESFNEPNDWAGGTTSQVEPYWFARYLESLYRAVKIDYGHLGDPSWQSVSLVSGPLFTHALDTGGAYFTQTWQAGINSHSWSTIKTLCGSYPLDGVGIHIYVAEGNESDDELRFLATRNLNAVFNSLVALEGVGTTKKLYLSEFGFRSDVISEALQAHKLDVSFELYKADSRIAQAHYFTLQDFPGGIYGLYRMGALIPTNRKPSYEVFRQHALSGSETPPKNGWLLY